MTLEKLELAYLSPSLDLSIGLSGGGASQRFDKGLPAEEVVMRLRRLAEDLERGVEARKGVST